MKVQFELGQHPATGRHYLLYRIEPGWTMSDLRAAGAQGFRAVKELPEAEMVDSIFWFPPGERFNFADTILEMRRSYDAPINNRIRSIYVIGLSVFGRTFLTILTGIAQKFSPKRDVHLEYNTLEEVLEAIKMRG